MKRKSVTLFYLVVFLLVLGVQPAFAAPKAYIDPNTGGMLAQALLVVFTLLSGVIFFFSSRIKMGYKRLVRFAREKFGKDTAQDGAAD
jgi:polyferredoxin